MWGVFALLRIAAVRLRRSEVRLSALRVAAWSHAAGRWEGGIGLGPVGLRERQLGIAAFAPASPSAEFATLLLTGRDVPLLLNKGTGTSDVRIPPTDATSPVAHKMTLYPVSSTFGDGFFIYLALAASRFKLTFT